MKTQKKKVAILLLLLATAIWGVNFSFVKMAINTGATPAILNAIRGFGLMVFMAVVFPKKTFKMNKRDIIVGIIAGGANSVGYVFQSTAMDYTTPSICSFLTIMNIVFVPVFALLIYRTKPRLVLLPAIIMAVVGTFILSNMSFDNFKMGKGEILALICAVSFAVSYAVIGGSGQNTSAECMAFWMGLMQMLGGVVSFFAVDGGVFPEISWLSALLPVLFLATIGTIVPTTLQVLCQKSMESSTATIIMTMEAVFGTIASLLFGYDKFSWNLLIGGLLIFCGVMVALLPTKKEFAAMLEARRNRRNE